MNEPVVEAVEPGGTAGAASPVPLPRSAASGFPSDFTVRG